MARFNMTRFENFKVQNKRQMDHPSAVYFEDDVINYEKDDW
jgi:hypothetical protein